MNRRNFLRSLIGGIAATAAVRTFPFRVYSFPKEITIATRKQIEFVTDPAPWSLHGLLYIAEFYNPTGDYMGISRRRYPIDSSRLGVDQYNPDGNTWS